MSLSVNNFIDLTIKGIRSELPYIVSASLPEFRRSAGEVEAVCKRAAERAEQIIHMRLAKLSSMSAASVNDIANQAIHQAIEEICNPVSRVDDRVRGLGEAQRADWWEVFGE